MWMHPPCFGINGTVTTKLTFMNKLEIEASLVLMSWRLELEGVPVNPGTRESMWDLRVGVHLVGVLKDSPMTILEKGMLCKIVKGLDIMKDQFESIFNSIILPIIGSDSLKINTRILLTLD